jgi:hypothetical protein
MSMLRGPSFSLTTLAGQCGPQMAHDGLFAVGGLVITGVRFFYFYTGNHYRYRMVAFGTFPAVFV